MKFQFHYGSIVRYGREVAPVLLLYISIPLWFDCEAALQCTGISYCLHFNSTMVRLWAKSANCYKHHKHISIPLWFDCESAALRNLDVKVRISIPLWFDCENMIFICYLRRWVISIPLWFDCEEKPGFAYDTRFDFNSTMVRLWESE